MTCLCIKRTLKKTYRYRKWRSTLWKMTTNIWTIVWRVSNKWIRIILSEEGTKIRELMPRHPNQTSNINQSIQIQVSADHKWKMMQVKRTIQFTCQSHFLNLLIQTRTSICSKESKSRKPKMLTDRELEIHNSINLRINLQVILMVREVK